MLDSLINIKFSIGRYDCYWLVNTARYKLGLPTLIDKDYLGDNYTQIIESYIKENCEIVNKPKNGSIAIIQGAELCLGCFYNEKVLCFNNKRTSELIDPSKLPILYYVDF